MRPRWTDLNELDRAGFQATISFLVGRLEERATVDWALRLKPKDTVKRLALLELIDNQARRKINEPWQTAWRLIEESWNDQKDDGRASTNIYDVQRRLRTGDRSGSLITAIVELVSPRLKIEPFTSLHLNYLKLKKRPKNVEDLFLTSLTSGKIIDPKGLDLDGLTDRSFLVSLAHALEASVVNGLDIARRIGWDGMSRLWQLGGLHRVYFVKDVERSDGEHEPDRFHRGIAPSVKLLHAVVSRLVDIDISIVVEFVHRWRLKNCPVHMRLWAALSRDSRVTPANEVGDFLVSLDDQRFWDLNSYPEIAEMRALRFGELDPNEQLALTARIRKRPPRNRWPKKADADRIRNTRLYLAVRELRRIEVTGSPLPQVDKSWLDARIHEFPELVQMAQLDEGFLVSSKSGWVPPNPDQRYDLLAGEVRLKALEAALSSERSVVDDDPAMRASDWLKQPGNPIQVLGDLESIPDGGAVFPRVWEQFGWMHSPVEKQDKDETLRDLQAETSRVLSLLIKLPETTVRKAIRGISYWLSTWEKQVVVLPEGLSVWLKLWPIVVATTNAQEPVEEKIRIDTIVQSPDDRELLDLDTLNAPAGRLVGVFLEACPDLRVDDHPFDVDGAPRMMRDVIISATGRSRLIALHRMIEGLHYFLRADPGWTYEHLIKPLTADNSEAIALWSAIARQIHSSDVLKIIGGPMAERATDSQLTRETRRSLVFSLVIECLHAFREQREPAVPYARIQQMIRLLDDEVRAYGAEAVQRFVHDISASREKGQDPSSPEQLFRSAAVPFLQQVWPQERSLATPGVSRALADLPATAREAFAEAVDTIERFLVPFECWSMIDYGLYGEEEGEPKLSIIDNPAKADAFLRLLDSTIGTSERSVVPYDLADALDQIRKVAPKLEESQVFRRLATAARRG